MKTILCFSGLDPSGGAGISADIEAIAANGCHCAPIVTALTIQDTNNVNDFTCVDANIITQQATVICNDMEIAAIKIGMLGNTQNIIAISEFLQAHSSIPVVLDPVLAAGGGSPLTKESLTDAICEYLLPYTTITTPNTIEAIGLSKLSPNNEAECVEKIMSYGCRAILITGTHANTENITHVLYKDQQTPISFEYARLANNYHGSGCTLAATIAALLAQGFSIETACEKALCYTWHTLEKAIALGKGQLLPNRFKDWRR